MAGSSAVLDVFSSVFSCSSGLAVGDIVYLSASDTVAKADGTDAGKMPALGIIVNKPTTTTCILQYGGELTTSGLTAGLTYYVSATGSLTSNTAGLAVIQALGVAKDSTTLIMDVPTTVGGQSITGNLSVSGNLTVGGNSGFYGVSAQAQPANTVDARHALVTLGLIASGGDGLANAIRFLIAQGLNSDYTVLTATSAAGKFQLAGAVGTATNLLGEGAQNNTKTDIVLYEFVLPPDYIAAANVTLTANVQRVVAGGTTLTTTIDCETWKIADDGTAGSDICATAVTSFTNTTAGDKAFTITGTTLSPGDRLLFRLTGVATEADNAGTVKVQINSVRVS